MADNNEDQLNIEDKAHVEWLKRKQDSLERMSQKFMEASMAPPVSIEGGIKKDAGKPQHDLIPFEALDEVAKVFTFGCIKYSRSDWAKGIKVSRLLSAAYRHIGKFNAGEDIDPESNLPHIAHAITNLIMLIYLMKMKPELDDRWSKEVNKCLDQKE